MATEATVQQEVASSMQRASQVLHLQLYEIADCRHQRVDCPQLLPLRLGLEHVVEGLGVVVSPATLNPCVTGQNLTYQQRQSHCKLINHVQNSEHVQDMHRTSLYTQTSLFLKL